MLRDLPNPIIFAHRGSSHYAPENTLAAFQLAIEHKADAIELDAKLTKDGEVVVIHDQTVDRTTDGKGRVDELTLPDIKELDAGSYFDVTFKNERIPTLREVFEIIKDRIIINVEITNYSSPFDLLPAKIADLVKQNDLVNTVFFSSFNPIALRKIHQLLPNAPIGFLTFSGISGKLARSWLSHLIPYQSLNPAKQDVNVALLTKFHSKNKKVYVYTVNEPEEMNTLYKMGVDGIFTDDPLLARKVLNESDHA
jgi:glycerophosphoryl diester phosphodiesterase